MGPVMGLADSAPASAPIQGPDSEPSVDGHPRIGDECGGGYPPSSGGGLR
jgi:hypothetical protein